MLVAVAGGAPTAGAQSAANGNLVALSVANSTGLSRYRWEIYGYPPGFECPDDWQTEDGTGIYYSNAEVAPPAFLVPADATVWGKWLFRVTAYSGALRVMADASAIEVVSPNLGLHGLPALEGRQFGGAYQQWVRDHEANLRLLDAAGGGGGGGTPLTLKNEGTSLGAITSLDVVGPWVAATRISSAGKITVTTTERWHGFGVSGDITGASLPARLGEVRVIFETRTLLYVGLSVGTLGTSGTTLVDVRRVGGASVFASDADRPSVAWDADGNGSAGNVFVSGQAAWSVDEVLEVVLLSAAAGVESIHVELVWSLS
jgi:hypothetical protein